MPCSNAVPSPLFLSMQSFVDNEERSFLNLVKYLANIEPNNPDAYEHDPGVDHHQNSKAGPACGHIVKHRTNGKK